MKKNKLKNIILTGLLAIFILVICLLKWYVTPQTYYVNAVPLCSLDGRKVTVYMEITRERYLFKPTELTGIIAVDRRVYRSENQIQNSFFKELKEKFELGIRYPQFPVWPYDTPEERSGNIVQFWGDDFHADTIGIVVYHEGDATIYFGPAETAEEARAVYEKMESSK